MSKHKVWGSFNVSLCGETQRLNLSIEFLMCGPHIVRVSLKRVTLKEPRTLCLDMPFCMKKWKPLKDISENGQGYNGKINVDWEGRKCISWEKHIQTYQQHYHRKTKHNICRNYHIDAPVVFCLVNKGRNVELSPCKVPLCRNQENFDVWAVSDLGERKPSKCNFPFQRLGKYF